MHLQSLFHSHSKSWTQSTLGASSIIDPLISFPLIPFLTYLVRSGQIYTKMLAEGGKALWLNYHIIPKGLFFG